MNYLNRENRGNHPSPKLLPCLLSRLKLVVADLIDRFIDPLGRDPNPQTTYYPIAQAQDLGEY
ncbi:MAG: hypothetical protein HC764_24395 [Pleurocapsa sp. CRU_1_2]|nr:hypothetical protein [Pleurocapsa sp. CRU_1_2]